MKPTPPWSDDQLDHAHFEWDDHNVGHILTHEGVNPVMCQEVYDNPHLPLEKQWDNEPGEDVYLITGETDDYILLGVVYAHRGERVRIATGYLAPPWMRRKWAAGDQ